MLPSLSAVLEGPRTSNNCTGTQKNEMMPAIASIAMNGRRWIGSSDFSGNRGGEVVAVDW